MTHAIPAFPPLSPEWLQADQACDELRTFLGKKSRAQWLSHGTATFYTRQSQRILPGSRDLQPTLDLANIMTEGEQGGMENALSIYRWVDACEKVAKETGRALFVENVFNETLCRFFRQRKYQEIETYGVSSFCKTTKPVE